MQRPSTKYRVTELFQRAPSGRAYRACLGGAIAFGAALPLLVGAVATYGTGVAEGLESLLAPTTDFSKLEQGEDRPGGGATSRGSTNTRNAFSLSSGNMGFRRELDFKIGNSIFRKLWVSAPASTDASDGLGPLFNSRGCQSCHLKDGRGHPPLAEDDSSGGMLIRLSVPPTTSEEIAALAAHQALSIPDPTYGGQLQDFAIQGHLSEGKIKIDYEERPIPMTLAATASPASPTGCGRISTAR